MLYIGIDQSLTSTALTCMNEGNELLDYRLIKKIPSDYIYEEDLLNEIAFEVCEFIDDNSFKLDGVALEGLSLMGKSAKKDLIFGNFWNIRTTIREEFPGLKIGIIPVMSWRSKVLTPKETKELKKKYKKDPLKIGCVEKLPEKIREYFKSYVKINEYSESSIFDLTDAYFIARYRLSLSL
jgi:hypothetical protein